MNQAISPTGLRSVLLPGYEIDFAREEIRTVQGDHVRLRPRSFAVLRLLASNLSRLVTKDELMAAVWNDAVVTEDSLTQCIADIRRALGDEARKIVRTVPRRGYLLLGDPAAAPGPGADSQTPREAGHPTTMTTLAAKAMPEIRYVKSGDVHGWEAERPTLPPPREPSLVVLPFQNMSADPEQECFVDGMVEEITTAIARLPWLFVIARNSSFTYKGGRQSM